jgi:hypothetical protein
VPGLTRMKQNSEQCPGRGSWDACSPSCASFHAIREQRGGRGRERGREWRGAGGERGVERGERRAWCTRGAQSCDCDSYKPLLVGPYGPEGSRTAAQKALCRNHEPPAHSQNRPNTAGKPGTRPATQANSKARLPAEPVKRQVHCLEVQLPKVKLSKHARRHAQQLKNNTTRIVRQASLVQQLLRAEKHMYVRRVHVVHTTARSTARSAQLPPPLQLAFTHGSMLSEPCSTHGPTYCTRFFPGSLDLTQTSAPRHTGSWPSCFNLLNVA